MKARLKTQDWQALSREILRSLNEALELLDSIWPDKLLLRDVLEEARDELETRLEN